MLLHRTVGMMAISRTRRYEWPVQRHIAWRDAPSLLCAPIERKLAYNGSAERDVAARSADMWRHSMRSHSGFQVLAPEPPKAANRRSACYALCACSSLSATAGQLIGRDPDVFADLSKKSRWDVSARVNRHCGLTTVRMSELLMRTALSDELEPERLKQSDYLPGFEDREITHATLRGSASYLRTLPGAGVRHLQGA